MPEQWFLPDSRGRPRPFRAFMRFIRSSDMAFWSGCWLTGAVLSFVFIGVVVFYVFFVIDAVVFAPPDVFVHRRGG